MSRTAGLESHSFLQRYSSSRNNLIREFYRPCLQLSTGYDRAAGYFRSSVFSIAASAMVEFAERGGRMRLVCSPELEMNDVEALSVAYSRREAEKAITRAIDLLLASARDRRFAEFLEALILAECLDIRIAFRPGAQGIFHDKVGVFRDSEGRRVSFVGSLNETASAWSDWANHEYFETFLSWTEDRGRVLAHEEYFQNLWDGIAPGVEVIPFPDAARERLRVVSDGVSIRSAYRALGFDVKAPRRALRRHQEEALGVWAANQHRGIFAHATGSGKTVTALAAIRDWIRTGRPCVVFVPSDLLLQQWANEVREEFGPSAVKVLLAGGGNSTWTGTGVLEAFTEPDGAPRVILASLWTGATQRFLRRINGGDHLLVVVDEVHRAGAATASDVLSIAAGGRLGLSATPHRFGDPEGTEKVLDYFGGIVHTFTLKQALEAGSLCPYSYFVHEVPLNDDEAEEYNRLTHRIRKTVAITGGSSDAETSSHLTLLLIQRARIAKQAAQKLPVASEVIRTNFRAGDRWLAYCDDQNQVHTLLSELRAAGLPADEYHSAMRGDKAQTLSHFVNLGGILVAIRCLDEGIDIPSIDHAVILASSRNPREFIQRRGRLLRPAEGKHFATVHDLLVTTYSALSSSSLAIGELQRAWEFAQTASNIGTRRRIERIAGRYGFELGKIEDPSFEPDRETDGNR